MGGLRVSIPKEKGACERLNNSTNFKLFDLMSEGVILQDENGAIVYYNSSANKIFNIEKNKGIQNAFPESKQLGLEILKDGKKRSNIEIKVINQNGEIAWIRLNAIALSDLDSGKPNLVLNTFNEITETQKTLNDLKQIEIIFNISQDIIIITNKQGYFIKINPRFVDLLGYFQKEIISKKIIDFVHPEDIPQTEINLKKLNEGNIPLHFISRLKTKSGKFRIFDWIGVPDNKMNLSFFSARDITDYKKKDLEFIHSSKVFSIGEMVSGIAFIMASQLSILGTNLAYLNDQISKDEFDRNELKKRIIILEASINQLQKTTKGLNAFSQKDISEPYVIISLEELFSSATLLCQEHYRIHSVALDLDIEKGLTIFCKESQIIQLIITILNNSYARVHNLRDSWIKVKAFYKDEYVYINFSDNSPENFENLPITIAKKLVEENLGSLITDESSSIKTFQLVFPNTQKREMDEH